MIEDLWSKLRKRLSSSFWKEVEEKATTQCDPRAEDSIRRRAAAIAPVVWLLGKTGSGKSSIVAALTGDARATVGTGFKPCTTSSLLYEWPQEAPVLRFLDTRGLGETGFDPDEDIAYAEKQAHILLVTMSVADPSQGEVVAVLREIRRRRPTWPIVVAQTTLHALYPHGATHPPNYPFTGTNADDAASAAPPELRKALRRQRSLLGGLTGPAPIFVPLDFTLPEDGYPPARFGLAALKDALATAGVDVLRRMEEAYAGETNDEIARAAHALILGFSTTAAASGAVPVPVVGVGGLATLVGLMLHRLASRYQVEWSLARLSEFTGAISLGALAGFGLRYGLGELVKLLPIEGALIGGALNAVAASALVYAIGRAGCVYLGGLRKGEIVSPEGIRRAFDQALSAALKRTHRE